MSKELKVLTNFSYIFVDPLDYIKVNYYRIKMWINASPEYRKYKRKEWKEINKLFKE